VRRRAFGSLPTVCRPSRRHSQASRAIRRRARWTLPSAS
jgi:hypothetical protein